MNCPQCNSDLPAGAGACVACGWSASRKTRWLVLGITAGVLFLLCCGVGTWLFFSMKAVFEKELPALHVAVLRAQVVNYAQKHGKAPESLAQATSEPVPIQKKRQKQNSSTTFQTSDGPDIWGTQHRLTMNADRSFEVRGAGPDGIFDNADDFVEKGSLDDDLQALVREIEVRGEEMMAKAFFGIFGFDADQGEPGSGTVVKPEPPPPAPAPGEPDAPKPEAPKPEEPKQAETPK
ncbi:MAG TPA: hypothetical protein VFS92_02595 [Planctomycetota bacterium]|nr:hypothetical protein [Planctomycetota bacterium]